MPRPDQTIPVQAVRREIRDLPKIALAGAAQTFAAGYRAAIADALKIINRALRRSGDGHSA